MVGSYRACAWESDRMAGCGVCRRLTLSRVGLGCRFRFGPCIELPLQQVRAITSYRVALPSQARNSSPCGGLHCCCPLPAFNGVGGSKQEGAAAILVCTSDVSSTGMGFLPRQVVPAIPGPGHPLGRHPHPQRLCGRCVAGDSSQHVSYHPSHWGPAAAFIETSSMVLGTVASTCLAMQRTGGRLLPLQKHPAWAWG